MRPHDPYVYALETEAERLRVENDHLRQQLQMITSHAPTVDQSMVILDSPHADLPLAAVVAISRESRGCRFHVGLRTLKPFPEQVEYGYYVHSKDLVDAPVSYSRRVLVDMHHRLVCQVMRDLTAAEKARRTPPE